jgi:hypothetical protein
MHSGALWCAAGPIFLVNVVPVFNTPLYYYQTDTLKLSQQFIGTLILRAEDSACSVPFSTTSCAAN